MTASLTQKWSGDHTKETGKTRETEYQVRRFNLESCLSRIQYRSHVVMTSNHEYACHVIPDSIGGDDMERIEDFHGTFQMFMDSMNYAQSMEKNGRKNIIVKTRIQDICEPNFLEYLRKMKNEGMNPAHIILEILDDDYGIPGRSFLENIEQARQLGFHISIHDFTEDAGGNIVTRFLHLFRHDFIPRFVHISERVLHSIQSGKEKFTQSAKIFLKRILQQGVGFILTPTSKKNQTISTEYPSVLRDSRIIEEIIIDKNGVTQANEGLIRFSKGISVQAGLDDLKSTGSTLHLLEKGIRASTNDIKNGKRRTVNIYLKDLGNPYFRECIERTTFCIHKSERMYLIFEILEERYGSMNMRVLENIRWLQSKGFAIAIDDLYVSPNNRGGMSQEILEILIENDIAPDFIKIDGRHVEDIRTGAIPAYDLQHLRQLIGQPLSSRSNDCPGYIVEWIRDRTHASLFCDTIGKPNIDYWFQGRDINPAEFRIAC